MPEVQQKPRRGFGFVLSSILFFLGSLIFLLSSACSFVFLLGGSVIALEVLLPSLAIFILIFRAWGRFQRKYRQQV